MFSATKSVRFNPSTDMPSLAGKVILVTGGNIGLGKQAILEFARHQPAEIWLAARSIDKAQVAIDDIHKQVPGGVSIKMLQLDLSSLESVKKAAVKFTSEANRLDILMLNAGIMASSAGLSADGYEIQFGTNHMGHALLFKLLRPLLERTAEMKDSDVRVVALSSYGHRYATEAGIEFDSLKSTCDEMGGLGRYGQSKLANILWARQLAKVYPQFTVAAIHPGLVNTNLMASATSTPFLVRLMANVTKGLLPSVENGAKNQLWASVAKDVKSGEYYGPIGVPGLATPQGTDDELARKLWEWTEEELRAYDS